MEKETRPVKYRRAVILPKAKLFNRVKWLLKEKYHEKPDQQFKKDVERLKAGEPLDYVIGFTEFLGCEIDLSKKPLIPRPETEYWVQKAIESIPRDFNDHQNHEEKFLKVLDMFSGSGCIGIAILKHTKNAKVVFVEKDKDFIKQIKINVKISKKHISNSRELEKRYKIVQSDIFESVKGKFDYIFANPPYIALNQKNKIKKSVLRYEPKEALFGGDDGLFYIRKFLADAKNFLNPGGNPSSRTQNVHYGARIFMEFDSIQKKQIEKILKKFGYKNFEFNKDQHGKWRWVAIENEGITMKKLCKNCKAYPLNSV